MELEFTMLGERGQAVIPKSIREKMPAPKGTMFSVVLVDKDTLIMKRIDKQKLLEEFRGLRASIKKKFSEAEIVEEIKKARSG
ncbi:MAG: hypothetical protein V1743_01645 [Nanoarchaeota archaeon]